MSDTETKSKTISSGKRFKKNLKYIIAVLITLAFEINSKTVEKPNNDALFIELFYIYEWIKTMVMFTFTFFLVMLWPHLTIKIKD